MIVSLMLCYWMPVRHLFSPPPSELGDCDVAKSLSPKESPETTSEIPKVLCDLASAGTKFVTAPKFTWNIRPSDQRVRLRKELSVVFSVDTQCTSQDIVNGFDAAGIDVDEILTIQRRSSNNTWVVSFRSSEAKNVALGVPFIKVAGCTVFLGDCENRVQIVKIFEAPTEMPDSILIGRLSHYGKVFSFRRDRVTDVIYNGIRTARMRLNLVIPPTICVAGELVRVWYPTQPKVCRRCGDPGHMAAKCSSVRCFKRETPGHRAEECPSAISYSICLSEDHAAFDCPFFLYSANVVDLPDISVPDVSSKVPPPVSPASYAKAASRSPEQAEAIKAAKAAGSHVKQPSEGQPPATKSSSSSSKADSSQQTSKQSSKKAASEPPPSVPPVKDRFSEKHAEREREPSRERHSGRDRDRDRERASARDHDRDRDHPRDYSREGERDRSGRRHHHHRHDSRTSEEDSDHDFTEVRPKRRSRR